MDPVPSGGNVVDGQPVDAVEMIAARTAAQLVFHDGCNSIVHGGWSYDLRRQGHTVGWRVVRYG